MVSDPPKPGCCLRHTVPQLVALAAAVALAILALALLADLPKRNERAPPPTAPSDPAPTQPLFMPMQSQFPR